MAARITHNFSNAGIDSSNNAIATILAAQAAAQAQAAAAQAQAQGNIGSARETARGGAIASNQQGLASLGNSYANAYNGYAGGLGNVAQAMANERSNYYSANAMAEAARQAAAGNIGSSALGAAGSGLSSALGAWGTNQAAYNQALASMQNANQMGLSQLGQSRNAALGQLGNPYASVGRGLIAADIAGGLLGAIGGGGGGSGGFSARGVGGPIASGSYSYGQPDSGAGSGFSGLRPGVGATALQGLNDLRGSIMDNGVMDRMSSAHSSAMGDLNSQHMSSRGMPMQMFNEGMGSVGNLARQAYSQLGGGMNQFYSNINNPKNRADFSGVLNDLRSGYSNANASIGTLPGWMDSGLQKFFDEKPMPIRPSSGMNYTPIVFQQAEPAQPVARRPFITDLRAMPTTAAPRPKSGPTWLR